MVIQSICKLFSNSFLWILYIAKCIYTNSFHLDQPHATQEVSVHGRAAQSFHHQLQNPPDCSFLMSRTYSIPLCPCC